MSATHLTSQFHPLIYLLRPLTAKPVTNHLLCYIIKPDQKKGVGTLKITLEPASLQETEVIIRGDVASDEVAALLQFLGKKNSGKLLLYRDEEQFVINISEIVFLETSGNRIRVYTKTEVYEAKQKLYELKQTLDAFSFAQISKSTILNINSVKSIQAEFSGNYLVKLKDRKELLTISRKYFKEFRDRI